MFFRSIFVFTCITMSSGVSAFDNEPDGFRGIPWKTELSTIENLKPDREARNRFSQLPKEAIPSDFPFASYQRKDDKLEFGNVPIDSISYFFWKEKFVEAKIYYTDSTNTSIGKSWGTTNIVGRSPPKGYYANSDISSALEKYFGKPQESKGSLLSMFAATNGKVVYKGANTEIVNQCFGRDSSNCTLTFSSTELIKEFSAEVSAVEKRYKDGEKAKLDQKNREDAEKKARPDF